MLPLLRKLPPAVTALLLQIAAFALALLTINVMQLTLPALVFALLCGVIAAALSHYTGLARWWLAIQFAFVPALVLGLTLDIPPAYFLAAFVVLLTVYWSTFRSQVPLYLSSNKVWQALESLLPPAKTDVHFTFVDIGSGLGGVLTHLARVRPDGRYHGIETAPLPVLWSWLRIKLGGRRNCNVHWGSMWDADLTQYDVVFAYLSPVPMPRLWQKAKAEMRPGSVFISSTFAVPEQIPQRTLQIDDLHHSTLLIWQM